MKMEEKEEIFRGRLTELFGEIRRLEMKGFNLFKETACIKRIKQGRLNGEYQSDWLLGETIRLLQIWIVKGKWQTLLFNQLLTMCLELILTNSEFSNSAPSGELFRVPLMMILGQLDELRSGTISASKLDNVVETIQNSPTVNIPENLYALLSIFERVDDQTEEGVYNRLNECIPLFEGQIYKTLGLSLTSQRNEFMLKMIVFFKKSAITEDNRTKFLISWLSLKCIMLRNGLGVPNLKSLQLFRENITSLLEELPDTLRVIALAKGVVEGLAEIQRVAALIDMESLPKDSRVKFKVYRLKKHSSVEKKRSDAFETDFHAYKKHSKSREKRMKNTNYKKLMFNDQNYSFFKATENNLVSENLERKSLTRTESAGLIQTKSIYGARDKRTSARLKERPSLGRKNSVKAEGNPHAKDVTMRQEESTRREPQGSKSSTNLFLMETAKRPANNTGGLQHQSEIIKVGDLKSFIKVVKHEANRQFTHGEASLDNTVFRDIKVKTELDRNKLDWKSLKYAEIRSESQGLKIWKPKVVALQIDKVFKEGLNALTPRPVYPKMILNKSVSNSKCSKQAKEQNDRDADSNIVIHNLSNKKKTDARKDMSIIVESEVLKEEEGKFRRAETLKRRVTQVMNAIKLTKAPGKNPSEASLTSKERIIVEKQATPPLSNFFRINFGDVEVPPEKSKRVIDSPEESLLNSMISQEAKENSMEAILNQAPDQVFPLPPKIIILPEDKKASRKLDMSLRVSKVHGGDLEIYKYFGKLLMVLTFMVTSRVKFSFERIFKASNPNSIYRRHIKRNSFRPLESDIKKNIFEGLWEPTKRLVKESKVTGLLEVKSQKKHAENPFQRANTKRRGSQRQIQLLPSIPTQALVEFNRYMKPFRIRMEDNSGKSIKLIASVYLMDDLLNRDKFFVVYKFFDEKSCYWIRTRISVTSEMVDFSQKPKMRCWNIIEKSLRLSIEGVKDKERIDNSLFILDDQVYSGMDQEQIDYASKVINDIMIFFTFKFCIIQFPNGKRFCSLNRQLKMLSNLRLFLHVKYGAKLLRNKDNLIKLPPVPYELLQLIGTRLTVPGDLSPVDIKRKRYLLQPSLLPEPLSAVKKNPTAIFKFQKSFPDEFGTEIDEISPENPRFHRRGTIYKERSKVIGFGHIQKAIQKFKAAAKFRLGWMNKVYEGRNITKNVKMMLLSLTIKVGKSFWVCFCELEPNQKKDLTNDIYEDFALKLTSFKFPSQKRSTDVIRMSFGMLPDYLSMTRKNMMKFIGGRVCGSKISRRVFEIFTQNLTVKLRREIQKIPNYSLSMRNLPQSASKGFREKASNLPKKTILARNESINPTHSLRHSRVSLLGNLPGLNDPSDIFKLEPQKKKPGVVLMAQRPKKFWKIVERVYDMIKLSKPENGLMYNAQTFNYIAEIPLQKKIYLLDSRGPTNLRILLELRVDAESRAVCGRISIYDFMGQRGMKLNLESLLSTERILPIISHPNELFKLVLAHMTFSNTRKEFLIGQNKSFRRNDIDVGYNYSEQINDVKLAILFDNYNGYLKLLTHKTIVFPVKLEGAGISIIHSETYHSATSLYVKFVLIQNRSKLALHKLVLRDTDIDGILGTSVLRHLSDEKALIEVYTSLFKKIRLSKRFNYSSFEIPGELVDPIDDKYAVITAYRNVFNSRMFCQVDSFIQKVVFSKKILHKSVTKINNMYTIVTVRRDRITHVISLVLYFPQTQREVISNLYKANQKDNESAKFEDQVKKKMKLLHRELAQLERRNNLTPTLYFFNADESRPDQPLLKKTKPRKRQPKKINDYQTYYEKVHQLMEEESKVNQSISLNNTKMNLFDLKNFSIGRGSSEHLCPRDSLADDSFVSRDTERQFREHLFWDMMMESLSIKQRSLNKYVLETVNCSNIVKEVVFQQELFIQGDLYSIEIIIENQSSDHQILSKFKNKMYQNIQGMYFFFKVENHTRGFEKNDKLSFFKSAELLRLDSQGEQQINIFELKRMAFLLSKKLYEGVLHKGKHRRRGGACLPHSIQYYIDSERRECIHLHSRICQRLALVETEEYLNVYRTSLMVDPACLLSILFSEAAQSFLFLVYDLELRVLAKHVVHLHEVEKSIFFAGHSIRQRQYLDLGKRLFLCYKNVLVIKVREARPDHIRPQKHYLRVTRTIMRGLSNLLLNN